MSYTQINQGEALYIINSEGIAYHQHEVLYIINSEGIAYHQHEVLYIIKPQVDTRWRVMRYKGGLNAALDDIRRTLYVDDIPSLRLG